MLNSYISTGYYVNDCLNGLQDAVTGVAIFTGFLNQCDADGHAYANAIINAAYLRSLSPCISDVTTTTTTTTTTSATTLPPDLQASGDFSYNWTGDFVGESNEYYDIVAWGVTDGYLSGNKYSTNQYFSSLSANDTNGFGTVLAVIKGSGLVTGFGDNSTQLLNIPTNLTGVIQVSLGYDHALALKSNGFVTGWGRDNWGALNILSNISNARKVCAGIGSSVFLLNNGYVTGTSTINGGINVNYPTGSGFLDIDHCAGHILVLNSGGMLSGIGENSLGESNLKFISGTKRLSAGFSTSLIIYNNSYVTGYGTQQAIYNTPNISNSGIDVKLKGHIGTILKTNQDILQWSTPWTDEDNNIIKPEYLQNNVVAISQGKHFTAAIFKRLNSGDSQNTNILTGHNYLWKVTYVGGVISYGGISIDDIYPPLGTVIQSCDNHSFVLPNISGANQAYTGINVPNCSNYAGTHSIIFNSIRSQNPILNINYTRTGFAPKTGFAATGITTGDYWNPYLPQERYNKRLYYSDLTLSPISGGWLNTYVTGSGERFPHQDNMYSSFISGVSGYQLSTNFTNFDTGTYTMLVYAHASGASKNSRITVIKDGVISVYYSGTTTGESYSSGTFEEGRQYIKSDFKILSSNNYVNLTVSGYINGLQIIKLI